MSNTAPIALQTLFRYYKGLPHQAAAIQQLEQDLADNDYATAMRRDRAWFQTWSQDGKQQDLGPALKLIQEFEGCHIDAYLCPAGIATIGWGNTRYQDGRYVKLGDKINRVEADMMLRQEVDRIAAKLAQDVPHWREMGDNQRSALVSFAYNLGAGFYGAKGFETITARLRDKDWHRVPEAMLLYRNPGSKFEAGLRRRREAEGNLWAKDLTALQQTTPNPLQVPWYSQLDSTTDQARRMCFSSSNAMLTEFLRPGTLSGANGDDQFLRRVQQYGDTTNVDAQLRALSSFGIKARFAQDCDFTTLEKLIDRGIPVPCGYIHRGPVDRPTGSGHWLCVVGYDKHNVIVHDPFGEPNLITGETIGGPARFMRLSRTNFGKRWMVTSAGNGTYRYAPGKGWAIIAYP
jgi:GH24 family phage-related lysozyme (muramidase)